MNPFSEERRHLYIISHNGIPATTSVEKEQEININLINIHPDIPIYRYMKWEHLKNFYTDHKWVLANPRTWQDKYEHFIFKCEKFYNPKIGATIELGNLEAQYFAQCWTLTEENSMQWQVNKPHSNSSIDNTPQSNGGEIWVKIKSTPKKLLYEMFYSNNNLVNNGLNVLTYFIGRVKYLEEDYIRNFQITDPKEIFDNKGLQQVIFLLMKRKPYECENEVRLIMQTDSDFLRNNPGTLVKRPIDNWYELIDEIVIDPWATDTQVQEVSSFMENLACQNNKPVIPVSKSHLNDTPRYLIPTIAF